MACSQDQSALAKGVIAYMGTVSELTTSRIDTKIARSPELKNFLIHLSERAPSIMNKLLKSVSEKCDSALRAEKESPASRKREEPPNGNEIIAKRPKLDCVTEGETARQSAVKVVLPVSEDPGPQGDSACSKITLPPKPTSDKDQGSREETSEDIGPNVKHGQQKRSDITFTSVCKPQDGNIDNMSTAPQSHSESSTGSQSSKVTLPRTPASEKDEHSRRENSEEEGSIEKPGKTDFSNRASTPVNPADMSTACDSIPGLTIGSQSCEMALPQSSALENKGGTGREDPEKDSPNTDSEAICVQQKGDIVKVPTAYEIESGLSNRSSIVENHVRASLVALAPTRSNINVHSEVTKVLKVMSLLDFFRTKRELYQYLENREKMPGEKLHTRTYWETDDPSKILETLENVKRNTFDNKIHRTYGQTMLFSSVNAQVAGGYRSTVTGHRWNHTALLEELARKKAGPVSEMEIRQTISSYFYEYYAGQRWLAVIDWFGGDGIVLVFVIAGNCTLIY